MDWRRFHRAEMAELSDAEKNELGDAFWRFSLALYARPGVADALIAMQDHAGRDVNVILFGLWIAVTRGVIGADQLAAAEDAIAPINKQAVAPMRQLRRDLKHAGEPGVQALRRRVAALEIAAERHVQHRLAATLCGEAGAAPGGDRLAAAQANLGLILGQAAGSLAAGALIQALAALTRRGG
jgi:uncharacterized protein (TIGR02444 family)